MFAKIAKVIVVILIVLGVAVWYVNKMMHGAKSGSSVEQSFVINTGEGVNQISSRLANQGIISHNVFFDLYTWFNKREAKIVAGTYSLRPNMTIPEIVDTISAGKGMPVDVKITVIEGWTNKQIGEYLAKENIVSQEEFEAETKKIDKYKVEFSFLEDLEQGSDTLEGFLFPDTYLIYPHANAGMIVTKMLANFDKKVPDTVRNDIRNNNHSIKEVMIMASIVEREVRGKNDQKIVAGIFWDRLENRYPLQSCATINYILGNNKKQLSIEDTHVESPYNTYIHKGLPPAPISNPGLTAIMAAAYPQDSDYFYFLSDPETGKTVFGRTLEEHNRNKEQYGL